MSFKNSLWKIATLFVVIFFLLKPEFMALGIFIDAIGLDLFIMLLEVQFIALFGARIKYLFKYIEKYISNLDPYFFLPTKSIITQFPLILVHAIPGFLVLYSKCFFWISYSSSELE